MSLTRIASFAFALLLLHPSTVLAARVARFIEPPAPIPFAPKGRNPYLASTAGRTHLVFRAIPSGIGHATAEAGFSIPKATLLPGTEAAASGGPNGYPVVAVDARGDAHVAFAPPSSTSLRGAYYLRLSKSGAIVEPTRKVSDRWIESLAVAEHGGVPTLVYNALRESSEPATNEGVFALSIASGGTTELRLHPFGSASDLAIASSKKELLVTGRDIVLRRWSTTDTTWAAMPDVAFPNLDGGAPVALRRPQIAFVSGAWMTAAVGAIDSVPTHALVDEGTGFVRVSSTPLFRPSAAEGDPTVAIAANALGDRVVAWLADASPRLRVSINGGAELSMPGTASATTLGLVAEGATFRLVFGTADGTLHAARIEIVNEDGPPIDVDAGSGEVPTYEADEPLDAGGPSKKLRPDDLPSAKPALCSVGSAGARSEAPWMMLAVIAACVVRSSKRHG